MTMILLDDDLFENRSDDEALRVYHLVNKVLLPYVGFLLQFGGLS